MLRALPLFFSHSSVQRLNPFRWYKKRKAHLYRDRGCSTKSRFAYDSAELKQKFDSLTYCVKGDGQESPKQNPYSSNWVQNIWEGLISSWSILGHSIHCLTSLCQFLSSFKRSLGNWSYLAMTTYCPIKSYKLVWGQTITFSRYSVLVKVHMSLL